MNKPGLVIAMMVTNADPNENDPNFTQDPVRRSEENDQVVPNEGEGVENLPPEQPDVYPLERDNPDVDEMEENQPDEQPEIGEIDAPYPDVNEVDEDTAPEIDQGIRRDENIDRDPIVQPGTDPMKTDNSQII